MMKPKHDGTPWFLRGGYALLAILLAGLAFRILHIVQLHGSDLWGILSLDARFYTDLAHRVASNLSLPDGVITYNTLYPVFLGILFRIFGESLFVIRILQSVIGLVTVWLLYEAGCRLSERSAGRNIRAGLIAAAMAVLYVQFVLFEGSILATSLVTLLLTASVTLLLVIDEAIEREKALSGPATLPLVTFGIGAMLGAGALGRPNLFLLLVPAVPLWFGIKHGKWLPAAMCLLGSVLFLLPPALHNGAATGRFVPLSAHAGINLYVGNGPDADGTFSPPPGMRASMEGYIADAHVRAEALSGRSMTDGEASRYWTMAAIEEVRADWRRWLALLGRKILLFWNGAEISDVIDISFYREVSWALKLPILPFSLISALSLVGFLVLWREANRRGIVLIFAVAGLVSVLPFFVNTRYRMPVVPLLILSAAFFVSWVVGALQGRRWRSVAVAGAACIALFSMTAKPMVMINRSAGYTFIGNYHLEQGREEKALAAFETAHKLDPDRVETVVNYARILGRGGDYARALQLYERAYRRWPDFPMLAVEYGSILDETGEREEAETLLRYAASMGRRRDGVIACKLLSRIALGEGRKDEAELWIQRALAISPEDRSLVEMLDWLRGSRED